MDNIIYIYTPYDKCQHFWHFMMGEFMPIISIIVKAQFKTKSLKIIVYNETRKWNQAFDIFYKNIENSDIQIELQNLNKNAHVNDHINKHYDISNMSWDWGWTKQDELDCILAVKWLVINTIKYIHITHGTHNNDIIIQDRRNNIELTNYFNETDIGTKEYGNIKRSVKDLDKLQGILSTNTRTVYLLYSDGRHIYEQIYPYINKSNIILGHGAGMFFTLFMKNSARVVEIIPVDKIKELNGAAQGLIRISQIKNFKLKRLVLDNHKSIISNDNNIMLLKHFFN